jgi:hypothetical protein
MLHQETRHYTQLKDVRVGKDQEQRLAALRAEALQYD